MKKIIIVSLVLFSFCSAYSQEAGNALVKKLGELTLEKDSLEKVIAPLEKELEIFKTKNQGLVQKLQEQQKILADEKLALNKKLTDLDRENEALNKNKVKTERDDLKKQVAELQAEINDLKQKNNVKEKQIAKEMESGVQNAKEANEKGKEEILAVLVNTYKDKEFDDLLKTTKKLSLKRDTHLIGDKDEVKQTLLDLGKYFDAEELLAQKYESISIEKAKTALNGINQQSVLLDKLKENIDNYKAYSSDLKNTLEKLIDLDEKSTTGGDIDIQKDKFNTIIAKLGNYMYDYYDYGNYPYLSDIVIEIIKRKGFGADEDITDLLIKLQ